MGRSTIKIEFTCGSMITEAIDEAIEKAREVAITAAISSSTNNPFVSARRLWNVEFEFNGITVIVDHTSKPDLVYRDWQRAMSGYIDKTIGPDYTTELSDKELASDAKIEAKNEARRAKMQAEWQAKADAKRAQFDAKLAQAPEMSYSDKDGWDEWLANQKDDYGYGRCIFRYAEWWARLMELELSNGKKLEEIADITSREADVEGITGFMYGAAVSILAKCWKHGEELRRWHNLETQIGNEGEKANEEGGTLNPALLSIG